MLKDNEKTKDTEKRELENEKDKGKWKGKETKPEPFYYQPVLDEDKSGPANDVEDSLADHTDVDNMDENNKFICKECTRKKGRKDHG